MPSEDPYFDLKQTLKRIIRAGGQNSIIMYRTDVPGYSETIKTLVRVDARGTLVLTKSPYPWASETHFFSIPEETEATLLQNRFTVVFEQPLIVDRDNREIAKLHLNLIDVGIKAPLYLRGKMECEERGFVQTKTVVKGVSARNDADATMIAAMSSK